MKFLLVASLLLSTAFAQWQPIPVPTTAGLRGLSVVNDRVLWASGTGGTVIRSSDAGEHWQMLAVPGAANLDLRGVYAFDEMSAVIMSSGKGEDGQSRLYRTTDGGKNWTQVFEEKAPGSFFDAIAFSDREHGLVVGDPVDGHFAVYRTEDAGVTWKPVPAKNSPAALANEGAFAASNSCLVVRGEDAWFATGGATVARVFRSKDRGLTWTVAETPLRPQNASTGIFSLAFRDARHGIAVGGDYAHDTASPAPNVMITDDGGANWKTAGATDPAGLFFSGVAFAPDATVLAVGSAGENASDHRNQWRSAGKENFSAVRFTPSGDAWAVGPKGAVARRSFQKR